MTLATVEKTDWRVVQQNFGKVALPDREVYVTGSRFSESLSQVPIASVYFAAYVAQLMFEMSSKKHDVVVNTFGDIINSFADLTYIHFPLRAALNFSQVPAFSNKTAWQKVGPIYNAALSFLDYCSLGHIATNSKFVQAIIRKTLNRNSIVIYPPVDVRQITSQAPASNNRDDVVVVIASYTPKRHLEQIPLIAKYSRYARFVIVGKANEYSKPTLCNLRRQISDLQIQDRIAMLINAPYKKLLSNLFRAKLYLHVMPSDHFGISAVEAMAAGCVPIVHKSGGPWLDILDQKQGLWGFSYSSPEEAAEHIDILLTADDLRMEIADRAVSRAINFDRNVFMKKVGDIVEKLAD